MTLGSIHLTTKEEAIYRLLPAVMEVGAARGISECHSILQANHPTQSGVRDTFRKLVFKLAEAGHCTVQKRSRRAGGFLFTVKEFPELTDPPKHKRSSSWQRPEKNSVRKSIYGVATDFLMTRANHITAILPGQDFAEIPLIRESDPSAVFIGFEQNRELYQHMLDRAYANGVFLIPLSDELGFEYLHRLGVRVSFFHLDHMGPYRQAFRDAVDKAFSVADDSAIIFFTALTQRLPKDYYRPMVTVDVNDAILPQAAMLVDTARLAQKNGFLPELLSLYHYADSPQCAMFTWGFKCTRLSVPALAKISPALQKELISTLVKSYEKNTFIEEAR